MEIKMKNGKTAILSQGENGMYEAEIRSHNGIESATIAKTQNEVMKWIDEHDFIPFLNFRFNV